MQRIDHSAFPAPIRAFSTLRGPLASEGDPYSGFSVCHYVGDSAQHIAACREELAEFLRLTQEAIVVPRQSHTDRLAIIDGSYFSQPADDRKALIEDVDALVTALPGVALAINTADCVAVLLADAEAGVTAAAHCGWRGCVNGLLPGVIASMKRLGADPRRITAVMGPSICADCFEVGEEVAAKFEKFPGAVVRSASQAKPHVDLPAAIEASLRGLGLDRNNLHRPQLCSRCNPGRLFSARALGIASGRTLSVIIRQSPVNSQQC